MSLEGLLTFIGIVIAVYALAQPIQRRSVPLFVPIWFVILMILFATGVSIWRYAVPTFFYDFYPWSDFASTLCNFFFPIIGLSTAYYFWHRAKLNKNKDKKFQRFILTSYYENRFDELIRILEKNEDSLYEILEPETLDLLFDRKFVKRMVEARKWIHMRLFSNSELVKIIPDRFKVTDNIIREFLEAKTSPLHTSIVSDFGGSEYLRPTKEERDLIDKTLRNPEWYMSVRIDYVLTVLACCEVLPSGKLDSPYNQNDEWYIAHQGESTRLRCPVYLALKTHVIMLKKAIEGEKEEDYYISDLWDLFREVCSHSRYDKEVWENIDASSEYPTPFVFLMKEILFDLESLCKESFKQGSRSLGITGYSLVQTWATCMAYLGHSIDKVSEEFKHKCIGNYLSFTLKILKEYERAEGEKKEKIKEWQDMFISEINRHRKGEDRLEEILFQSLNNLDYAKPYIFNHHNSLRRELGLKEKPGSTN